MHSILNTWGWSPFFEKQLLDNPTSFIPGRVLAEYQHLYSVMTAEGELRAQVSGKFAFSAEGRGEFPSVGDWVLLQNSEPAIIHQILERKNQFSRKAIGQTEEQVIAANVDLLLIVSALNRDFNLRRLERYLTLGHASGAELMIVLNKSDLCEDLAEALCQVRELAIDVPVFAISALHQLALEPIKAQLEPGKTLALVGSSGVGKSTLVNALYGDDVQAVQAARENDARGRHTTTHRELIPLPDGGLLLDSPGMRELQLWDDGSGLDLAFQDVLNFMEECKYRNCHHQSEPGCGIQLALSSGDLVSSRWGNYLKLQKEEAWLEKRHDQAHQRNSKKRWKQLTKTIKNTYKNRDY